MKRQFVRLVGAAAVTALFAAGCSPMSSMSSKHHAAATGMESASSAADLRVGLNSLLGEHVLIAAVATSHALGGREAAFKGAAGGLDTNSIDLAKAIGSVYGADAEKAFLPLWRKHIGFFVDYTTGVATKDKAKQERAVADLIGYTEDFGAFLGSANPNLPKSVVADLVKTHVVTLKDVVDAQAAGDWPKAYSAIRSAYNHMHMIGDPLAAAIAKQFPGRFAGM